MTNDRAKRRPRRIAADEAHAWARNLRLGNLHAKMVLSMLTLYVDGEGSAFVGIPSLAEDCELSPDTVRRRLGWLEEIGAIARVPQWLDENGNRNSLGRGKRTTDLIKLLIEGDQVEIEYLAAGNEPENPTKSTVISPSQQQGLDVVEDTSNPHMLISPRLGLGQDSVSPSYTGEGLISEPEPEPDSPIGPQGGVSEPASPGEETEPEHFAAAWAAWRGHEAMRRDLALDEFRKLPAEKQRICRNAIPLFNAALDRLGRTRVPNFHLWIRARGFEEFPGALQTDPAASRTSFDVESREGNAIVALYAVARARPFETRGCVVYAREVTPQILAFADAGASSSWQWIEDRQQIGAWSSFLSANVLGARPPLIVDRGLGDAKRSGIFAPWPWPPRKDGNLSSETGDAA
jgi:hypothetical protein